MAGERYFIRSGDRDKGPYTVRQLRESVAATAISEDALVHKEGEEESRPLADVLREARQEQAAKATVRALCDRPASGSSTKSGQSCPN